MDAFKATRWNQIQLLIWVWTRDQSGVQLAADRFRIHDPSKILVAADAWTRDPFQEHLLPSNDIELIGKAIIKRNTGDLLFENLRDVENAIIDKLLCS